MQVTIQCQTKLPKHLMTELFRISKSKLLRANNLEVEAVRPFKNSYTHIPCPTQQENEWWPQQLDPEQSIFIYFSHIHLQDQFNHNKNFSIYHVEILFATYIQVQSFLTSRLSGAAGELQGIKTDTEEQLFCTSHLFSIGLIHCSSQQYKILLF